MKKRQIMAGILSLLMVATPCISFAQEWTAGNESAGSETSSSQTVSESETANAEESAPDATASSEESKDRTGEQTETASPEEDTTASENTSSQEEPASTESDSEQDTAEASFSVDDPWETADFTYGDYEKLLYGCDYSRQFYVKGKVITGFSEQGEAKFKVNKDLVIPAKDPDGNNIVGIGNQAFCKREVESVQFPTGMSIPYDDSEDATRDENITRRGNFVIGESAFYKSNLKEVTLPVGVVAVMAKAFESNQIQKVTLPRTIWWIENEAFADNQLTTVGFPTTTDFMLELHGMPFAFNQIKSVRLPDFTEVVNQNVFAFNPGMEKAPTTDPWNKENKLTATLHKGQSNEKTYTAGVVYMYTDNASLKVKLQQRIHSIEGKTDNIYSPYQRLIINDGTSATQNPDSTAWNAKDFQYDEYNAITGLSESGEAKRKINKELVIPSKTPDGDTITEIGSTQGLYGLFATEDEQFDSVFLPNTIQKVGERAFYNSGLKDITFSNNLKYIDTMAFSTNKITSVNLPDSVTYIGKGAFSTNAGIERITLPRKITEISDSAFGCSDGKNYMSNLTEIEIPNTVERIGKRAFAGNNFHNIVIPSSVKEIGEYAFSTKNYLSDACTLTLNEGLETIGDYAFRNKVIDKVELPSTVKGLPLHTFLKQYTSDGHKVEGSITKVYVPTVFQYEDRTNFPVADAGTQSYHKLYLTDSNRWTPEDYTYTANADAGPNVITGFSELGLAKLAKNSDVVIPAADSDGSPVTGIAAEAFSSDHLGDRKITGLRFETGISSETYVIGQAAFSGDAITELHLASGITEIAGSAFKGNALSRVEIPSSVAKIGDSAFEGNQLTDLVFGGITTATPAIGSRAFAKNKITSLQLPTGTTGLSGDAFVANTGNEAVTTGTQEEQSGGVVYIYMTGTLSGDLEDIGSGKSNVQKIINSEIPSSEAPWSEAHFTYNTAGNVITGLSDAGREKLKNTTSLILPESIGGLPVTRIGSGKEGLGTFGFEEDGKIYVPTEVILPSTLTGIDNYAFDAPTDGSDSTGLTSITLPESLVSIGKYTFRNASLESVTIPDSVTAMGVGAFSHTADGDGSLTQITLSKNLSTIPEDAFRGQSLKTVTLPNGTTAVEAGAFEDNRLQEVTLSDQLETIGDQAFRNHQLEKLTVPDSVKTIGESAFAVNSESLENSLTTLTLGSSLETIGENAFQRSDLSTVELPDSVKVLPESAFSQNNQMAELRTSSEDQLNGKDPYQKVAKSGAGHTLIYDKMAGTGWDYSDFLYSEDGTTILGWSDAGEAKRKKNHRMVLPDKASYDGDTYITGIGDSAFAIALSEVTIGKYDATSPYGVQSVEFPKYLETIGNKAFEYNNLRNFDESGNVVDTPTDTTGEISFLSDAEHLTSIGESAFHGNHLCNVTIPDTVTEMGTGAFAMNNIYKLKLSRGMDVIPAGAFSMNIRMSELEIPDNVTEIGQTAFAGARLTSLTIPKSVTKIGRKAFHLHHLTSLRIPGNVKEIGESAFEGTYKAASLETLIIEEGVESIGKRAFKEGHLSRVKLPGSLKSLGDNAFENNTGDRELADSPVVLLTSNEKFLERNSSGESVRVVMQNLSKQSVVVSGAQNRTYSGKSQSQNLKVQVAGLTLKSGRDYRVTYSGNKAVGTATTTITGTGDFYGKKTVTFRIDPPKMSLSKVKKGKKSFTATWKKKSSSYTTGYQIQYSTSSAFRSAKTKTVTSYKKNSLKVKKLKKKKNYYVRIRIYKTVKGKKYYSGWSGYKKVKTK